MSLNQSLISDFSEYYRPVWCLGQDGEFDCIGS